MDDKLCEEILSEYIREMKTTSQMQQGQFLSKLGTLYEVAYCQNLKSELTIKIEKVLMQLEEKYESKTNEGIGVEQKCFNYKDSVTPSMSENPVSITSSLDFLTELSDQNVKAKKDKSDKYTDNSRHRSDRHENSDPRRYHEDRYRSNKGEQLKIRRNRSVTSERSRHGKSDRYHYEKSDKDRYPDDRGEEKHDLFESRSNYSCSSSSKHRINSASANNCKPENQQQSTQIKVAEKPKCNGNKSLTLSELSTSALRKVYSTSHIPKTELKYKLDLLKRQTTSKECTSTLSANKSKCSDSIDDDIINKVLTEAINVKNNVFSLQSKGDSSIVVQQKSATTKMIEETEKIVAVTSDRKSLNEVTPSNNPQIFRPTNTSQRLRKQRLQEQQNSSLFYSKPIAFMANYPPVIQSKPANKIYNTNQYSRPAATPNIDNYFPVHHGQPHLYPSNITSQYPMPSQPIPLMDISIPYSRTYSEHKRNPPSPITYGEYRRRKAAEELKNKIVVNTSSTDITRSRLDNVYRSSTFSCTPNKKPNTHDSDTAETDWDDFGEIACVNSNSKASKIRDPPSESSLRTNNQSSVIEEEVESVLKQFRPNSLLTLLNKCGMVLDDNKISRLRKDIQSWIQTNQSSLIEKCTQNPPKEVVQTVALKPPRKNELEKLHEDIRSIFICDEEQENESKDDIIAVNKKLVSANGVRNVRRRLTLSCSTNLHKSYTEPSPIRKRETSPGAAFQEPKTTEKALKPTKTINLSGDTNDIAKPITPPCSIVLEKLGPLASVKPEKDGRGKRKIYEMDYTQTVEAGRKKRFLTSHDGVNAQTDLIVQNNVRETSMEKTSSATEEIFEEPDVNWESYSSETVAKAKQRCIQDSTTIPTQLTTTFTRPDISTLVTLNAGSLPAKRRDDSRVVSLSQWLHIPTMKLQKYCTTMLRDISLFALYKCMDINCAFTTNDFELMLIHLRNHENNSVFQINNLLETGSPSWLQCSYCNKIGDSCLLLLEHIQHEHQSSIFQCPYCFYRSCASCNVIVHLSQFHQFEQQSVLVCNGKTKEYATQKTLVEKSRLEFVYPLRCTEDCKEITFAMDHFLQHTKSSPAHFDKFKCQVCGCYIASSSAAKHLISHTTGVLECAYCHYGTDGVANIQNHMCNSHPSKLPFICMRLMKSPVLTDEQLRSLESTLTVHLGQSVDPKLFHRCPYTEQQLNFLSPTIKLNSILSQ